MRKFNWMLMLLTAATLSFAACTKDSAKEEPTPGPEEPAGLTFEVEIDEVTYSSVSYIRFHI